MGEEKSRRRRRTSASARREILDAAERQLMQNGPDGLRLQAIAADLGISHSSILHHFGSRDGLLDALAADTIQALERELQQTLVAPTRGDPAIELFQRIGEVLADRGFARLIAWQIVSRRAAVEADPEDGLLDRLAQTLHALRREAARKQGRAEPDVQETRRIVAATACFVLGEGLGGEMVLASAGLGTGPGDRRAFRSRIAKHLERVVLSGDGSPEEDATGGAHRTARPDPGREGSGSAGD